MSVQEALRIAGMLSCVMAAALAILAVHAFVKQDIPGVLDDLSGRRRQRALAATVPLPPLEDTASALPRVHNVVLHEHDVATELAAPQQQDVKTLVHQPVFDVVLQVVLCDESAA